jgi:ring-1,2-phenylacetyl-CoA epoxidase subunit PaaE
MSLLAKHFGPRYQSLRRDLAIIVDSLLGNHPPPLIERPARAAHHDTSATGARRMRVASVIREAGDATSLILEDLKGAPIEFVPGQFFTVLVSIDGLRLRRAYSASSSYLDKARLRLTIKRTQGGTVSGFLNDTTAVGDTVQLLGPSGSFTFTPDSAAQPHLVMIGGGSGITPLMAIAHALTASEAGRATLIYSNRDPDQVIFADELEELAATSDGRLRIAHSYGDKLDPATLNAELDAVDGAASCYYICGPDGLMSVARATLIERGVDPAQIKEERFASPHQVGSRAATTAQPVLIRDDGAEHRVTTNPGETILDAGLRIDAPLEYSCTMGGCGACMCKLTEGEVAMEEPNALSESEREAGYILACVSRPLAPVTIEVE